MKQKVALILTSLFLLSCGNNNIENKNLDSINKIIESEKSQKEIELEISSLKEQNIFGKWKCNFKGYESIIYLKDENNKFSSIIEFDDKKRARKIEKLIKKGNKYLISKSPAKEYYLVNKDGNLELWDDKGLFSIALNQLSTLTLDNFELSLKKVINKDVHLVVNNISKSMPLTLEGTSSQYWIVYYEDINTTFRVLKSSNKIEKAKVGKIENLK